MGQTDKQTDTDRQTADRQTDGWIAASL